MVAYCVFFVAISFFFSFFFIHASALIQILYVSYLVSARQRENHFVSAKYDTHV